MTAEANQGDLLAGLTLPRSAARILRLAHEIQEVRPERPDYLHSGLCQVGLPRSATKSLTFERTNGHASLLVEAVSCETALRWYNSPCRAELDRG